MNANGKYLISSGERAENNTLRREVAEGGDLGSRVYDSPPHRLLTDALLTVWQVLLVSHHEAAPPSLIKLPVTLRAAQQAHGAPADRTLSIHRQKCLEMKHWGRDKKFNLTLQATQTPGTLLPSPSIFILLVLGGTTESHNVFLMQWCIFLLWRYAEDCLLSLDIMAHTANWPGNGLPVCMHWTATMKRGVLLSFQQLPWNQK